MTPGTIQFFAMRTPIAQNLRGEKRGRDRQERAGWIHIAGPSRGGKSDAQLPYFPESSALSAKFPVDGLLNGLGRVSLFMKFGRIQRLVDAGPSRGGMRDREAREQGLVSVALFASAIAIEPIEDLRCSAGRCIGLVNPSYEKAGRKNRPSLYKPPGSGGSAGLRPQSPGSVHLNGPGESVVGVTPAEADYGESEHDAPHP